MEDRTTTKQLYKRAQNKNKSPYMVYQLNPITCNPEIIPIVQEKHSGGVSKCWCERDFPRLYCAGCKNVVYCSKSHQKEDWKKHKDLCHYLNDEYLSAPTFIPVDDEPLKLVEYSKNQLPNSEIYRLLNCKFVESLKIGKNAYLIVNEDGRFQKLKENSMATLLFGSPIYGSALLVKKEMIKEINFTISQVKEQFGDLFQT